MTRLFGKKGGPRLQEGGEYHLEAAADCQSRPNSLISPTKLLQTTPPPATSDPK